MRYEIFIYILNKEIIIMENLPIFLLINIGKDYARKKYEV